MSILRRIALVVKSAIGGMSKRVDNIAAEEEMRQARAQSHKADIPQSTSPDPPAAQSAHLKPVSESLSRCYALLGLRYGATIDEVETAWRSLSTRSDPKRFPSGSNEEKRAAKILDSLNDAYTAIREHLDPTEGRFGRLEL